MMEPLYNVIINNKILCLHLSFRLYNYISPASLCRPPLRGSTYCFTAVSVSVSVSFRSHPKAPPAQFFLGAPKYDPSYVEIIFHW